MFNISPHFHFEKTYLPCEIREKLLRFGFIIEDSSTTTHMPMGLWSILFAFVVVAERFGKRAEKIANNLVSFIVKTLEALERRYTVLNYFISLLIAFKVRKPENSLS